MYEFNLKKYLIGERGSDLPNIHASLEAIGDMTNELEIEYEIYGKIVDFSQIEKHAVKREFQEQYQLKRKNASVRVRATTVEGETKYVLCSKFWDDNKEGNREAQVEVAEELFEHFKHIADSGMIKDRYFIKAGRQRLPDGELKQLFWEVDVFHKPNGERSEWCKIDLEVEAPLKELPKLPIDLDEAITNSKKERTREEKEKLSKLFKEEFLVPGLSEE